MLNGATWIHCKTLARPRKARDKPLAVWPVAHHQSRGSRRTDQRPSWTRWGRSRAAAFCPVSMIPSQGGRKRLPSRPLSSKHLLYTKNGDSVRRL